MVTYNAPLGVHSVWHYHNGELDPKRTSCIQQLSKRKKLTEIGYRNIWKIKNSHYVEPWHPDDYKYCLISKLYTKVKSKVSFNI